MNLLATQKWEYAKFYALNWKWSRVRSSRSDDIAVGDGDDGNGKGKTDVNRRRWSSICLMGGIFSEYLRVC